MLARLVLGVKKYDRIACLLTKNLGWFLPAQIYSYKLLCLMYKIIKAPRVEFFSDYFIFNNSILNYCTSNDNNLNMNVIARKNYGFSTFHFKSIVFWNNLPENIKSSTTIQVFKKNLKIF